MALKKVNAIFAWILIILLMIHISTTVCYMLTGWYDLTLFTISARAVTVVCIAHVVLSLGIVFFMHDGANYSKYGGLNKRTIIQRASGLVILLLVHPHVKLFASFIYEHVPLSIPKKILVFAVEGLFFSAVFLHLGTSFSRSLITMGLLRTERGEKAADLAAKIVCVAGCAVALIALLYFLVNWPAA